jgi:hypothetical protein
MTSPSCEYIPLYFFCEIYTRADHHLYSSCWRITRRMRSFLAPWLAQVMLWLQATSNEGFRFRSLSCCICNVPGWDSMVLQKTCALAAEHQFCLDHVYLRKFWSVVCLCVTHGFQRWSLLNYMFDV